MAGVNNTPFVLNCDILAQLSGTGAPFPFNPAPTYATNTSIVTTLYQGRFVNINTTSAVGNTTILASNAIVPAGTIVNIQVTNDATAARTITFGTGFRSTAVITGTNSKAILVQFISDGLTLNEISRSASGV